MPISIIIDKSTFQSLNMDEIFFLNRYYQVTIAPVLLLEVLADLKKNMKGFNSQRRVIDFARKILQLTPEFTTHYKYVINSSLLGYQVLMDGRPHISGGEPVTASDGKKGYIFHQSLEEKALHRWSEGKFTEAEEFLAEQWRETMTEKNILEKQKQKFSEHREIDSLESLNKILDEYLNNPQSSTEILVRITDTFSIDYKIASQIFYRYEQTPIVSIKDFAPYAFYCYKIHLFFSLGILNGLISTRSTNKIDLEYLFYLPFCNAFSSNDKFHKLIVPFFLEPGKDYIQGSELKSDLKSICTLRNILIGEERDRWAEKYKHHPPEDTNSITYRIWKKYARPSVLTENISRQKISEEAQKKVIDEIHKYMNSLADQTERMNFDDPATDFILRERWISPNDYCPCGSGKIFKDCCLPEAIKSQKSRS